MSVLAVAIKHLVALGMTGDALQAAITEMQAAEDTRSPGARRQQRYRDKRNEASQSVTRDDDVTHSPALSPSFPPDPQSNPIPTPVVISPRARKTRFAEPAGVSPEQWAAFTQQRRKALSEHAYRLICKKLAELAEDGWPPGDMIDLAIERGWESVFAPKDGNNGISRKSLAGSVSSLRGARPSPALDLMRRGAAGEAAEAIDENPTTDWRAWRALPSIGSG